MPTALYLRSSRRDPVALARQREMLEQLCRRNGWEFRLYEDEVSSDDLEARPGLTRMLLSAEKGDIDRVLVTGWDRLAKDPGVMQEVKNRLRQAGIPVLDWYMHPLE